MADGFDWGSLIGPLLSAGVSLYGNIQGEQAKEDFTKEQWARDDAKAQQDTLLKLQLEQLKAAYGSGGGGSPGNQGALTAAQRVSGMQNAYGAKIAALKDLMSMYGSFK